MVDILHSTTTDGDVSDVGVEVFQNYIQRARGEQHIPRHSPALRAFALTLHFYSPKAYSYVRKTFKNVLPHQRTIRRWYERVNGEPGLTSEALLAIRTKYKVQNSPLLCCLMFDEMAIRKHIEWDRHKLTYRGYVDMGTGLDHDTLPVAKEALVFMLVALDGSWKIPIGYFLLDGIGGHEKASLVKDCLSVLSENGAEVVSLTFDGTAVNFAMAKNLGCTLDPSNEMKTYFPHPVTSKNVTIFLDPAHMLKLVRNTLGDKGSIFDSNDKVI